MLFLHIGWNFIPNPIIIYKHGYDENTIFLIAESLTPFPVSHPGPVTQ